MDLRAQISQSEPMSSTVSLDTDEAPSQEQPLAGSSLHGGEEDLVVI